MSVAPAAVAQTAAIGTMSPIMVRACRKNTGNESRTITETAAARTSRVRQINTKSEAAAIQPHSASGKRPDQS